MLAPEKPPIAETHIWGQVRVYINLQPNSLNQRRFPLYWGKMPRALQGKIVTVVVPCVCGDLFHPFREKSMFFTAPGHTSCAATARARRWALWTKLDIGKKHAEHVQYSLYDED